MLDRVSQKTHETKLLNMPPVSQKTSETKPKHTHTHMCTRHNMEHDINPRYIHLQYRVNQTHSTENGVLSAMYRKQRRATVNATK